ncbi:hypothetical protein HID58_006294 [Brassica napus]|uniref:Pollen-specific leucine-rich repeat extensin-like protein 1 n=1 Tax=Brassica napus TaxID=3708 RepID=A0ABQ8EB01_BRANA|nr:hypothetical protein HID58_006294 [Brassica napus]
MKLASPPLSSSSRSGEHQPPLATEAKIPPLPPFLETGENQPLLAPSDIKAPKSTLKAAEESLPEPPTLLLPSKVTLSQSSPPLPQLSESGELQPPLPPAEYKIPPPPPPLLESGESQLPLPALPETKIQPSKLNAAEEFQSPPVSSKLNAADETHQLQESPAETKTPPLTLYATEESLPPPVKATDETLSQSSETGEPQHPLPPPKAKIPLPPPSTQNAAVKPQFQPLPASTFNDETPFKSSPQPPLESKITPSKLNTNEESTRQPSKSIDETRSQSSPPWQSSIQPREAKTPPSKLNASKEESHVQPLPPSLPLPESNMPPPPPSPQTKPNPIESHTSKDHRKDRNQYLDKPDAELRAEITGEVKKTPTMMMFINSNVQGINTSLSLDSSSIDHEPGVHLTIDHDDFSSTLF